MHEVESIFLCICTLSFVYVICYNVIVKVYDFIINAPAFTERRKTMPVRYKIDVLAALKEKGYTTYKLKQEKLLAESTIQKLRTNTMVSIDTIGSLCKLLGCQVGDLVEYVEI